MPTIDQYSTTKASIYQHPLNSLVLSLNQPQTVEPHKSAYYNINDSNNLNNKVVTPMFQSHSQIKNSNLLYTVGTVPLFKKMCAARQRS